MDILSQAVDLFLNLDQHLQAVILQYGIWTYLILFFIIFMETGFVVTPFLPGDSLLFAAGTFAALGAFHVLVLFGLMCTAAILGDSVNYWIGNLVGPKVFEKDYRLLKREYLERTQSFYERHGGKTIFLARFVPIVRTFAPFVAGVGSMRYSRFLIYNLVGGLVWTATFIFLGFFFGNIPFVARNFELVVVAIILVSVAPMGVEFLSSLRRRRETAATLPDGP